nr:MAG TPA: hypothetical protein [Caudoviricetes sp.]
MPGPCSRYYTGVPWGQVGSGTSYARGGSCRTLFLKKVEFKL